MRSNSRVFRSYNIAVLIAVYVFRGHEVLAQDAKTCVRETTEASTCRTCCSQETSAINPNGGPNEATLGLEECTAPSGPLEPSDGYGSVSMQFELASYVSARLPGPECYSQNAAGGNWDFDPPSLTHDGDSPGKYTAQFSATRTRVYDSGGPCANSYSGRNDNRFSTVVRNQPTTGLASLYDRSGRAYVFTDPYNTGGSSVTSALSQIVEPGGSRQEYQYSGSPLKLSKIWFYDGESLKYTRLFVYSTWSTQNDGILNYYFPSTVDEYVAIADVTSPTATNPPDPAKWALKKKTIFRPFNGTDPNGATGDLMAIDELIYVSYDTTPGAYILKRNAFRYHTLADQSPQGLEHQLLAHIGPDSYQDFLLTAPDPSDSAFFGSTLASLESGNYIDTEYGFFTQDDPPAGEQKYLLNSKILFNEAGSCGCAGTPAGANNKFVYEYVWRPSAPQKDDWNLQLRVSRFPSGGGVPIPYASYIYTSFGKKIAEIMYDPADQSHFQIQKWLYSYATGQLMIKYLPSACQGYNTDPNLDDPVTARDTDGAVYHYYYTGPNDESLSSLTYTRGAAVTQPETALVSTTFLKRTDPANACRSKWFPASRTDYIPEGNDPPQLVESTTIYAQETWHAADPLAVARQATFLPALKSNSPDQNGEDVQGVYYEYFDKRGRRTWTKDASGAVTATTYHQYHGGITSTIQDVNTAPGFSPPPGTTFNQSYVRSSTWPNGGSPLNLTTTYSYDKVGRLTTESHPNSVTRTYLHTKLLKGEEVLLAFPHLSSLAPIGPLQITVSYPGGRLRDQAQANLGSTITSSNYKTATWNPGQSTLVAALIAPGSQLTSRTSYVTQSGHVAEVLRYINPTIELPSPPTNSYRTQYGYDDRGRRTCVLDPPDGAQPGTITKSTFDFLGRLVQTEIGTSDGGSFCASSTNLLPVELRLYDGQAVGSAPSTLDGKLTKIIQKIDGTVGTDRNIEYEYDYDLPGGMLLATKWKGPNNEDVQRRLEYKGTYVTAEKTYLNFGVSPQLRAWQQQLYDARGQIYETRTIAVDANGTTNPATDYLHTRYWRNQRGEVVKSEENGGVLAKTQYDGIGRVARSTLSWQLLAEDYASSTELSLAGDTVVSQSEMLYDAGGNVILEKELKRQPNYAATGLLPHASPTQARGRYVAIWYDVEDRETVRLDYGDNGGANLISRPTPVPSVSDANQLQTRRGYNTDGQVTSIVDPQTIMTKYAYDALGRTTQKTENYGGSAPWGNRITSYSYTPTDQIRTITAATAINNGGVTTPQITTYVYGVSASQPVGAGYNAINSNRLLQYIEYPQDDNNTEREYFAYDRQGATTFRQDIAGIQHRYDYAIDGSLKGDVVVNAATIGQGFDANTKSIYRFYDDLGRLKRVMSQTGTAAPPATPPVGGSSGSLNGVAYVYGKYGEVLEERQNVNNDDTESASCRRVTYAYNYPVSGGLPGFRLISTTYPSGLVINENYTSGTTDYYFSRVTGRAQSGGPTLFQNTYLGLSTVLKKNHPGPQIDWDVTLDRFERTSTLTVKYLPYNYLHNSYQYGYNFDSQVTYRKELTTAGQSEQATYNGLSMLSSFKRGVHDAAGNIASPTWSQYWQSTNPVSLDHSGNWRQYSIPSDSVTPYSRYFNKSNELTSIQPPSGSSVPLTYDLGGNTKTYGNILYTYDLWNRLTKIQSGGQALVEFEYNGLHQKAVKKGYLGDQSKFYYYNGRYQVVQEYSWDGVNRGSSNALYSYVHGAQYIDELIARRTESAGTWEYYMQDANFNVISRISMWGSLINRYTYTPYGVPTQLSSSWATGSVITEDLILFTGREWLKACELYNYRSRLSCAPLGKFLQRDVIGIWGDLHAYGNAYSHCGSDPLNVVDPLGYSGVVAWARLMLKELAKGAVECCADALLGYENYIKCLANKTEALALAGLVDTNVAMAAAANMKSAFKKLAERAKKAGKSIDDVKDQKDMIVESWYAILKKCNKTPPIPKSIKDQKDKITEILKGNGKLEDLSEEVKKKASDWYDDISRTVDLEKKFGKVAEELNKQRSAYLNGTGPLPQTAEQIKGALGL